MPALLEEDKMRGEMVMMMVLFAQEESGGMTLFFRVSLRGENKVRFEEPKRKSRR